MVNLIFPAEDEFVNAVLALIYENNFTLSVLRANPNILQRRLRYVLLMQYKFTWHTISTGSALRILPKAHFEVLGLISSRRTEVRSQSFN